MAVIRSAFKEDADRLFTNATNLEYHIMIVLTHLKNG